MNTGEFFTLDPDKRRWRIVCFGSHVNVGPMSLKAIGAAPKTKTSGLKLDDARVIKAELEILMRQTIEGQKAKKNLQKG